MLSNEYTNEEPVEWFQARLLRDPSTVFISATLVDAGHQLFAFALETEVSNEAS
jgi:hypothetical protein